MELCETFGFLKILNESLKILPTNGTLMASITTLSLLLPSILVLLFCYFYQTLTNYVHNSIDTHSYYGPSSGLYEQMMIYLAVLGVVEVATVITYFYISHTSGIATILVSAMSFANKKTSLPDLLSRIKSTWIRHLCSRSRRPRNPASYALAAAALAYSVLIFYRNLTILIIAFVLVISVAVSQLYASIVWSLFHVISVVEDNRCWAEALEKAKELVKGQRRNAFMINLYSNLVPLVAFLGGWMMFGDEGFMKNLTVYGLLFVNSVSLGGICKSVAYTVLYFQCKKERGEEIRGLGDFESSKLIPEKLGSDAA